MEKQSGIIYQNQNQEQGSEQKSSVSFISHSSNPGVGRGLNWRKRLGFLFLSASLAGLAFFLSPYIAGKIAQNKRKGFAPLIAQDIKPTPKITEVKTPVKTPDILDQPDKPEKPIINSFYLTIEKIGLHGAPVIPEIEANSPLDYEQALRYGLVHAQNSALPDESGMIYIFGHSANYPWILPRINALFFQIEKVNIGDKIKIEYNGKHFLYHVFDKKIVNPDQLDLIKANINQDILVLQSCYPRGTALKRLLLFAKPSKMGALIY